MAKGSGNNRYLRRAGGGLPGRSSMGGGNANALAQAQELLAKAQAELAAATVEGTAGGGAVRITMSGEQKILGIALEPEVVDPDDVEMLQDLIMAAIADATQKTTELQQKSFGAITGGLGLPGLGLG
ncbi:YbaB/EbfC family nucleoid-associated protein [Tepidiforma sp.]|jgi:DNA-binding YbaB/EbfC family protein|uniref:YbaB/EbfC family nucleoid-associated protein n=1 Tax=Tepidiforma sp. TaxID=2682230 RepID=UPI00260F6664|nr:YbaB/EbfC family nucleoid-associated protein [Tepidiforma sp.]MCX7617455.1 YbaB/EbfC family nucleoid-associated protein [Tepidiforma sp.]